MNKLNTLLLIVLIGLAAMNLVRAQEVTEEPQPQLESCTAEEMQTLNNDMDEGLQKLADFIGDADKSSVVDYLLKIQGVQGYYWGKIGNGFELSECIEKYTLGYSVGKAIDDYFVSATMSVISDIAAKNDRASVAEMTANYAKMYITGANLDFKYIVPDLYEKYLND